MSMIRIYDKILEGIRNIRKETPCIVAIDGVDGAGKSYFAQKLSDEVRKKTNREVVCVSVDGFHFPEKIRYRKGRDSPEGFYRDSYDYDRLEKELLLPFFQGKGNYRIAFFDVDKNENVDSKSIEINNNSILIMEGIFLFRPRLINYWDFKIFLDINFQTALERNIIRAGASENEIRKKEITERYLKRYRGGQEIYLSEVKPKSQADLIIDNNDFNNPIMLK